MKRLPLIASLAACLSLCACAGLSRSSNTQHANYTPSGKRVQPLHVRLLWGLLGLSVAEVNTGLANRDEADTLAVGTSAGDKTALSNLVAKAAVVRKGSNLTETVGYTLTGFDTDVSTNTAGVVEAGGKAAGQLLNKAVTPTP